MKTLKPKSSVILTEVSMLKTNGGMRMKIIKLRNKKYHRLNNENVNNNIKIKLLNINSKILFNKMCRTK
jgi:hypothetical protein